MKDELGGKTMPKFVGLRAKISNCLIDNGSEDKKAKDTKKIVIKIKLKSGNYRNCLEAIQLENKMNYLKKIKLTKIVLKNHTHFIRNNKSILKRHQWFKSERHSVFTEEINNIALSLNNDKGM